MTAEFIFVSVLVTWAVVGVALAIGFHMRELYLKGMDRWPGELGKPWWSLNEMGGVFSFGWPVALAVYPLLWTGTLSVALVDHAIKWSVKLAVARTKRGAALQRAREQEEKLKRDLAEVRRHVTEQGPHR